MNPFRLKHFDYAELMLYGLAGLRTWLEAREAFIYARQNRIATRIEVMLEYRQYNGRTAVEPYRNAEAAIKRARKKQEAKPHAPTISRHEHES
jgi:hypothetical protein